jgi:uncharacterized protein Yka (UPF0111/DUF47 family)
MIPISWGELFDKLTILEIKQQRVTEEAKLANIRREFAELAGIRDEQAKMTPELVELVARLSSVNARLWDIEDEIRTCERGGDFSERFIELARSVYKTNDRRAELKYRINKLLGSHLVEEKSYEPYQ